MAFLGGVVLAMLFGEEGVGYAGRLELGIVLGTAVLAVVLTRVMGTRVEAVSDVEATIAKKAQGALVYALLNAFGITAPILLSTSFPLRESSIKAD